MELTYRWLEGEDLKQLEPMLEARGHMSLNNALARALCVFDKDNNDKIIAFHVLQHIPHAEPLYVDKEYRGTGIAEDLADRMVAFLKSCDARGFMVVADNPASVKLCEQFGMRRVESPVFIM